MPKKQTTIYSCSNCDAQFPKWMGQCTQCGKWSTISEEVQTKQTTATKKADAYPTATMHRGGETKAAQPVTRTNTNIGELDRVFGGGIVPGSLTLLGGEPGIGKSTLSAQLAAHISNTYYFSGEESIAQVSMRVERLGLNSKDIALSNETVVESICASIKKDTPPLVVIDSIQTIYANEADGEPGGTTQIRATTTKLLQAAKQHDVPIIIIGHVTKDGNVAGPRTLEHMVDTVLYFEGDRYGQFRMLRSVKNRFGATDEVGMFEMTEQGLKEVNNPSAVLLEERGESMPGSVVTALMEGTRPILVEIQALVNKTVFGYPVRKASGFDLNRLHVLTAVLQKRAGINLGEYDIHINVVGGIQAREPAADLAVCFAIASSFRDKPMGKDLVVFGEVGLGGEVRSVTQSEKRIKEATNLGMQRVITRMKKKSNVPDISVVNVKTLQELVKK